MSEIGMIKWNSLFSFLSMSSRLVANVIVFWIVARYFGPEIFGQFTFAHTTATILILVADFGFDVLLTTDVAKNIESTEKIFRQYFSLKFLFTSLALFIMWAIALFNDVSSQSRLLLLIFSLFMVFTTFTNFLNALFKGLEKLKYETKVAVIVNAILFFSTIFLILINSSILFISCAFVLTRVIGLAFGIKFAKKLLPSLTFKFDFNGISHIKNKVLVFGLHLLFSNLFFQIDTLLLGFLRDDYAVGIYQSVFKLIVIPLILPEIFVNSLMPVLSRQFKENVENWKRIGFYMHKVLLIVIIPVGIILFIFSPQIINLVYGQNDFADAIPLLKIFSVLLIFRFSLEPFALMLTTSDRQKIRMVVVVVATMLNVALNFYFIPIYGILGAATVSLFTNLFVGAIYYLANISLFFEWLLNIKNGVLLVFSAGIFYCFWTYLQFNLFVSSFLIFALYLLFALIYYFSDDEKKILLPSIIKIK